jgi:cation-transporting ATPase 13A2
LSLVVNTGYSTRKGRVIRKILNPKDESNELFKNIMQSSFIMMAVNACAFLVFFNYMFDGTPADTSTKILIFATVFLQSLPAVIPVFINMAYTIFLLRLKLQNIFGLNRVKTIESSRLETICFDKTGTLTENEM